MVSFLAELTTHEGRARDGRKNCTKRQFGIVASVIVPADVTVYAEDTPTTED